MNNNEVVALIVGGLVVYLWLKNKNVIGSPAASSCGCAGSSAASTGPAFDAAALIAATQGGSLCDVRARF